MTENLRTTGQNRRGRIRTGRPVANSPGSTPFSSIPTKFEAVTRESGSEQSAFGSCKPRFTDATHSLPGPGAYFKPCKFTKDSDSVSRRGYGSLTSNDHRWRHAEPRWTGPGPGEYDSRPRETQSFSRAAKSANFQDYPAHLQRLKDGAAEPGPGTYDHMAAHHSGAAVRWVDTPHTGHVSAFKARPRDLVVARASDAPGAGSYELGKAWGSREQQHSHFKDHSTRETHHHRSDNLPAVIFSEHDPAKLAAGGPGPGAYNIQAVGSIHRKVLATPGRVSSGFVKSRHVDRFGQALKEANAASTCPGPGAYGPTNGAFGDGHGMCSSFVSTANKSTLLDEKRFRDLPPGPAYYKPEKHSAKASFFHQNAKRRFV